MVRGVRRPLPLAVPSSSAGAVVPAFPSPSRVGQGLGSPHVSPLDKAREAFVVRMYQKLPQHNVRKTILEMLQDPSTVEAERFPERTARVTKDQVDHAIRRAVKRAELALKGSRKRPRGE